VISAKDKTMSAAKEMFPVGHIMRVLMARHENDNDEPEIFHHHDVRVVGRTGWGYRMFCTDCDQELDIEADP